MDEKFVRTAMVLGPSAVENLRTKRVAVFGIGGVGGNCAEALARSGVGTLDLIDSDDVCESNLNRQVFALHSTIGMKKTDAAKQRIMDISPETAVNTYPVFYLPETADTIDFSVYDYIIDAIDTVTAKLDIIERAGRCGVPVISSMGCGNRVDPSMLRIMDIYDTKGDPLAKVMRRELRKRGIKKLPVCCSLETPLKPLFPGSEEELKMRRSIPGSTAFVPPAAGIMIASYVVRKLISFDPEHRA
jgi:tRNA A37 threonylcarbamoyladenosine dehydratase